MQQAGTSLELAIFSAAVWRFLARIRRYRSHIVFSMLCAVAGALAAPAGTQALKQTDAAEEISQQLLSARSKQQAGEYNAARVILNKALSEAPNSISLLDALGSVEQDLG